MKNFEEYFEEKDSPVQNPFIYMTSQVESQIKLGVLAKVFKLVIANSVACIITAPIQTVITSLQLSVLPHKQIFATAEAHKKQLAKLNTELTIAEKRRIELMIRSGGQFQPYVAPVYEGYQQTIRNLARQGWKAFFKGLSFRLLHSAPHILCYGQILNQLTQNEGKSYQFFRFFGMSMALLCFTDCSLNLFNLLEQRYILQNNIKQFRVFRNVPRVIGKVITQGQLFKGISYHAINNLVELAMKMPVLFSLLAIERFTKYTAGIYLLSEIVIYPFQTAYKRFVCQSTAIPGMIPTRYQSIWHAVKVIAFEEKLKGLYRGFGLHAAFNIPLRFIILQLLLQNFELVDSTDF